MPCGPAPPFRLTSMAGPTCSRWAWCSPRCSAPAAPTRRRSPSRSGSPTSWPGAPHPTRPTATRPRPRWPPTSAGTSPTCRCGAWRTGASWSGGGSGGGGGRTPCRWRWRWWRCSRPAWGSRPAPPLRRAGPRRRCARAGRTCRTGGTPRRRRPCAAARRSSKACRCTTRCGRGCGSRGGRPSGPKRPTTCTRCASRSGRCTPPTWSRRSSCGSSGAGAASCGTGASCSPERSKASRPRTASRGGGPTCSTSGFSRPTSGPGREPRRPTGGRSKCSTRPRRCSGPAACSTWSGSGTPGRWGWPRPPTSRPAGPRGCRCGPRGST